MGRKFNTWNHYNMVGFYAEFQENIRAVKYLPENKLICVTNACWDRYWEHPEDIDDVSKLRPLPRPFTDDDNPFEEADFSEITAAGWMKYLRLSVRDFDFNESVIRRIETCDDRILLYLSGGYLSGRDLIPTDPMDAPPTVLTVRNPEITLKLDGNELSNRNLTEDFTEFWQDYAKNQPVHIVGYMDSLEFLYLRMKNFTGHLIAVTFRGKLFSIEIEKELQ